MNSNITLTPDERAAISAALPSRGAGGVLGLAERLGISRGYLHNVLAGKRTIQPALLKTLLAELGLERTVRKRRVTVEVGEIRPKR